LLKLYFFTKGNLWFLIISTILATIATYLLDETIFKGLSYPAGFLGTALAFLIGFRNNSGYDRWWEARKIWGKLINDSRHFGLKVISFVSNHWNDSENTDFIRREQQKLVYRHIAFVWSLNKHLRKLEWEAAVQPFLEDNEFERLKQEKHIPLALLKNQVLHLKVLYENKYIDDFRHMQFDNIMENFNDALGKSERIKNTVFPMQYNWFMKYAISVFSFIFPFSLTGYLGYWSIPFSIVIGFVFIMLEYVGRHIETPFENQVNDTPLNALSRTIEINLRELLDEKNLPKKIEPEKGLYLY
ncbi:MAG: putative membrane protein, partial [Patescibacteria group bacterium]